MSRDEAGERVAAVASQAAADWTWYGVAPVERAAPPMDADPA
jgi:hypothetical protein